MNRLLQRATLMAFSISLWPPPFSFLLCMVGTWRRLGSSSPDSGEIHLSLRMARNMFAGSWMTFIDHVLADLGAPAAYRAKVRADMEAMIGLGFFKQDSAQMVHWASTRKTRGSSLISRADERSPPGIHEGSPSTASKMDPQ
jgi:hypothetical protein